MTLLLSRSKSTELWDLVARKPLHVVPEDVLRPPYVTTPLALSPDRRLLLCSDMASGLLVWDLVENRRRAHIGKTPTGTASNAAFSHDGRRIVTAGLNHVTLWELLESSPSEATSRSATVSP
jgi:hypothetical protein